MKNMKDFDIAKYLREHQLGSYGILNHYVDLKPLKEEETEVEMNSEVPYEGPEHKLTGNGKGDEFEQADTVSEEMDGSRAGLADFADAVTTAANAGLSKGNLHTIVDVIYPDDSKQAETVSEEETEFQRPLDWEDLDNTDISGPSMEVAIDNLIGDVKSLIDKTFPNDPGKKYRARIMIKMLWNEKLRDWKA